MLYMLTRVGEARDWDTGLPLKASLLGKTSRLEIHHIFPKSLLYASGYSRAMVNSLANYCFLTQATNLNISNTLPEVYSRRSRPGIQGLCRRSGCLWTRIYGASKTIPTS